MSIDRAHGTCEGLHEDKGAAYVFVKAGRHWHPRVRLTGSHTVFDFSDPDHPRYSGFGFSVAVTDDGRTILVGTSGFPAAFQEAYVFVKKHGTWTEKAILPPSDGSDLNEFGSPVALARGSDTALIGAECRLCLPSQGGPEYLARGGEAPPAFPNGSSRGPRTGTPLRRRARWPHNYATPCCAPRP